MRHVNTYCHERSKCESIAANEIETIIAYMQIRFRLEMEFWMRQLIVTEQKNIQPDIVVYNISETFVGNEKKTSIQS